MSDPNTQGYDPDLAVSEDELEPTEEHHNTTGAADGDVEADTASGGSPEQ
jgi:hypothetical protein